MKSFNGLDKIKALSIARSALKEDIGRGDITTGALFTKPIRINAEILSGGRGIVCGLPIVESVFKLLDRKIRLLKKVKEGANVKPGETVCVIVGDARKILAGERTALNFLGRLSGIATLTNEYVKKVKPYRVKIMDTRKTTPGLRQLEKYAVKIGGGYNHRMGLWDQVLVKDNHIAVYRTQDTRHKTQVKKSLKEIIQEVRKGINKGKKGEIGKKKKIKIEIEVQNLKEFKEALEAKPDIIMLDNMQIDDIKKAVKLRSVLLPTTYNLLPKLEVSGGVTLENVRAIAKTGVDMISIGALTHSVKSLDFSLEV